MKNPLHKELEDLRYISISSIDPYDIPESVVIYFKNNSEINKKMSIETIHGIQLDLQNQNPTIELEDYKATFCLGPSPYIPIVTINPISDFTDPLYPLTVTVTGTITRTDNYIPNEIVVNYNNQNKRATLINDTEWSVTFDLRVVSQNLTEYVTAKANSIDVNSSVISGYSEIVTSEFNIIFLEVECTPSVDKVSCLCLDVTKNYKVTVDGEEFTGSFEDVVTFLDSHGLYAYPSATVCGLPELSVINVTYDSFCQTMTVTGDAGLFVETKDSNGNVIGSGVIGPDGTVTYPLNTEGQVNNTAIYTKSALSNTVSHSLVLIPSNEIHFTTLEGYISYEGTSGDEILLSDGTIINVIEYAESFDVPAGKQIVKLVESVDRGNYVSISGGALVELHNFPTLSTVTHFSVYKGESDFSGNLIKVPNCLPSNITNTSYMFSGATSFNQDISGWDVSNVTDMNHMFEQAWAFNQDISDWDVSNVTNMNHMFEQASLFNQPLDSWNTSNVTDISYMFYAATSFNQPLNNWNVSNVIHMSCMFYYASLFNQPLNNWDVSNVTNMRYMFADAISFNQNLSMWCVNKMQSSSNYFNFNYNTPNWTLPKPVWGTCPP